MSRRVSASGAKFEAPANQPCSNVLRTSRPTRSSPARSRPRRPSASSTRRARPCSSTRPTTSSTNSSPDLLAILNSGHRRRTAYVIRSVPTPDGGWAPAKFNTFTGIAFAGLEILPETLQDRSLGCRSTRRPGKRSRSTWPTATAPSSSSAGANSPAGPRTCRSCRA